jgi:hypothetical protein
MGNLIFAEKADTLLDEIVIQRAAEKGLSKFKQKCGVDLKSLVQDFVALCLAGSEEDTMALLDLCGALNGLSEFVFSKWNEHYFNKRR